METDRKSYNQICPVANALDIIGDRWTILILRDLLGGAARFNELKDGLPGIAKNLLTERLRRLEEDGVVTHHSSVYALTEQGEALRDIIEEIGMWGARAKRVAPIKHQRSIRAIAMAVQSILVRAGDALPTEQVVIELEIDGEFAEVVLSQSPTITVRPTINPHARARISGEGMADILAGRPFDNDSFTLISGEADAISLLVTALK